MIVNILKNFLLKSKVNNSEGAIEIKVVTFKDLMDDTLNEYITKRKQYANSNNFNEDMWFLQNLIANNLDIILNKHPTPGCVHNYEKMEFILDKKSFTEAKMYPDSLVDITSEGKPVTEYHLRDLNSELSLMKILDIKFHNTTEMNEQNRINFFACSHVRRRLKVSTKLKFSVSMKFDLFKHRMFESDY